MRDDLVSLADIEAAARRLSGVATATPLVPFPGRRLQVKAESLQVTGSFKVRGAYNAISSLPAADRERGV
ncbi:MAG: threonine/serine dehydratase, partial [Actinobacteria bacterium]|nr:threonine/serine dehydratase [Actinomycetota bacterium]